MSQCDKLLFIIDKCCFNKIKLKYRITNYVFNTFIDHYSGLLNLVALIFQQFSL